MKTIFIFNTVDFQIKKVNSYIIGIKTQNYNGYAKRIVL